MSHEHEEIEARLRAARARPDPGFVARLEGELFPAAKRPARRWTPVLLGAATSAAIATLLVALSLAGSGPLGGRDEPSRAGAHCDYTNVTKRERVPHVAVGPDGEPVVRHRFETRTHRVKRCR